MRRNGEKPDIQQQGNQKYKMMDRFSSTQQPNPINQSVQSIQNKKNRSNRSARIAWLT
jgi:hypothetical protein